MFKLSVTKKTDDKRERDKAIESMNSEEVRKLHKLLNKPQK
jgi:hypothetical protein